MYVSVMNILSSVLLNICNNKQWDVSSWWVTYNEVANRSWYWYLWGPDGRFRNPYSRGCQRNCTDFPINGYSDEVTWPTPKQTVQGRYRSLDGAVDHGIVWWCRLFASVGVQHVIFSLATTLLGQFIFLCCRYEIWQSDRCECRFYDFCSKLDSQSYSIHEIYRGQQGMYKHAPYCGFCLVLYWPNSWLLL